MSFDGDRLTDENNKWGEIALIIGLAPFWVPLVLALIAWAL